MIKSTIYPNVYAKSDLCMQKSNDIVGFKGCGCARMRILYGSTKTIIKEAKKKDIFMIFYFT